MEFQLFTCFVDGTVEIRTRLQSILNSTGVTGCWKATRYFNEVACWFHRFLLKVHRLEQFNRILHEISKEHLFVFSMHLIYILTCVACTDSLNFMLCSDHIFHYSLPSLTMVGVAWIEGKNMSNQATYQTLFWVRRLSPFRIQTHRYPFCFSYIRSFWLLLLLNFFFLDIINLSNLILLYIAMQGSRNRSAHIEQHYHTPVLLAYNAH